MESTLSVIGQIVHSITGHENLTPDIDFVKDLALNSFEIVSIVCEIEKRYEIRIPTRDIWNLNQVRDVIQYLEEKAGAGGA